MKINIKNRFLRELISWILYLGGAAIFAVFISTFVIINAEVISGSMEPTIMTKDKVIGFRQAYLLSEPKRGDIIMFRAPDSPDEAPYVKRVIGLPGETVRIDGGKIYINYAVNPLDESVYLKVVPNSEKDNVYEVPQNSYFVLGDNRNKSLDSPLWKNKYVPKEYILSKVILRIQPKIGFVK